MPMNCSLEARVPPSGTPEEFRRLASDISKQVLKLDGQQPWKRAMLERPGIRISSDAPSAGRIPMTLWMVLDTPLNAVWAAGSDLRRYYIKLLKLEPRFARMVITTDCLDPFGYAPFIKWKIGKGDSRDKLIRPTQVRDFLAYLHRASTVDPIGANSGSFSYGLMRKVASCEAIQKVAIRELLDHAERAGYLQRSRAEAADDIDRHWAEPPALPRSANPRTRWSAIKLLYANGHIAKGDRKQRPIRPAASSASFDDVIRLVENSGLGTKSEIVSATRCDDVVLARYFTAHLMRSATSRSLAQVGRMLGGRDHTSVLNGIRRIEAMADGSSINAEMLDVFAQIADNIGICKGLRHGRGFAGCLAERDRDCR